MAYIDGIHVNRFTKQKYVDKEDERWEAIRDLLPTHWVTQITPFTPFILFTTTYIHRRLQSISANTAHTANFVSLASILP